jgi:hypothetical protein
MNRTILIALAMLAPLPAFAQEVNFAATRAERPNLLEVRTGVDHGFVGQVGYRRAISLGDRNLFVGADLEMPWAAPDLNDYRVRASAGLELAGGDHWKVAGWIAPTLRGTQNVASTMTALGADLRLLGGYYSRGWFVAGEAGFDWVATTRMSFSEKYRTQVYAGAQDAWYANPGGTIYAGMHGGISFSSFDVVLRLGQPRAINLAQQALPFYLTLGVNAAL